METPKCPAVDIAQIAKVCHEANRAYSQTLGDTSLKSWEESDQSQRDTIMKGVLFRLNNPGAGPEAAHESWFAAKVADGWKLGPVKDVAAKIHPSMVPFAKLPLNVQIKDTLFTSIVHSIVGAAILPAPRSVAPQGTLNIVQGKQNDPSVEIGVGASAVVVDDFLNVMRILGFREQEGSFVYNADGRAIWVNPASPYPGPDITDQIVRAAESIGQRSKINEIRKALDIPFQHILALKNNEDVGA